MLITAPGPTLPLKHSGGDGTVSFTALNSQSQFAPGDFGAATMVCEVSFDGGDNFYPMVDGNGDQPIFSAADNKAVNFSSAACNIRAVVTGTPTGGGVEFGVNPRGQ